MEKIETVTLAELNNYVLNSPSRTADFICTIEVGGIDTTNGCCDRKLQCGFTSFRCACFNYDDAVSVVRYHVQMVVTNSTDSTTEITKLTNVPALEVAQLMVEFPQQANLPQCIQQIIS